MLDTILLILSIACLALIAIFNIVTIALMKHEHLSIDDVIVYVNNPGGSDVLDMAGKCLLMNFTIPIFIKVLTTML